jgi:hypothetical protein
MQKWATQVMCGNTMRFILGVLAGVCLMLVIGMAEDNAAPGPYQCCPAGDDASSVFVLDTQTAEVWLVGRGSNIELGTPFNRKSVRTNIPALVK